MAAIITAIQTTFTGVLEMVTSLIGTITASGNELLLFFILLSVVGIAVGMLSRLLNIR